VSRIAYHLFQIKAHKEMRLAWIINIAKMRSLTKPLFTQVLIVPAVLS